MLALSWIALGSAHIGRFAPAVAAFGAVAAGSIAALLSFRRLREAQPARTRALDAATVAMAMVAALALRPAAEPWPAFYDASWYQNAAAGISSFGSLSWAPEALKVDEVRAVAITSLEQERAVMPNVPAWSERGFHAVAFASNDPDEVSVHPYHPPMVAAGMAVPLALGRAVAHRATVTATSDDAPGGATAASDEAPGGATATPGTSGNVVILWALCYLLAVASLARASFGPVAGLVAVAGVAANPAFAYYGAAPYAEVPAGALALAGLVCLLWLCRPGGASVPGAALAGLLLGCAALAKLELAALLVLSGGWWLLSVGRGNAAAPNGTDLPRARLSMAFLAGAAVPCGHLLLLAAGPSRLYVELNVAGVLALLGVAPLALSRGQSAVPVGMAHAGRRVAAGAMALAALAITVASLVPVAEGEIPTAASVLVWFVTPLVLWAAVVGGTRSVLAGWRPGEVLAGLVFATLLLLAVLPGVTAGLSPLYTVRRFVPVVIPGLTCLATGAAVVVAGWEAPGRRLDEPHLPRWAAVASGAAIVLALAALLAKSAPLRELREFDGGAVLIDRLASTIPADALVLFPSPLSGSHAGRAAAPLWTRHGRATAVLTYPAPSPAQLTAALDAWTEQRGGPVYFVGDEVGSWPGAERWSPVEVDRSAWVAAAPASRSALPPGPGSLGLEYVVSRLEPGGEQDAR